MLINYYIHFCKNVIFMQILFEIHLNCTGNELSFAVSFPDISIHLMDHLTYKEAAGSISQELTRKNEINSTNSEGAEASEKNNQIYIATKVLSIAFILLIIVVIFFWRRYQRNKKNQKLLTKKEIDNFLGGDEDQNSTNDLPYSNIRYDKTKFEIDIKRFAMDTEQIIGVGEYGVVYKGTYKNLSVAIKTLKPNADIMYFKSLLSELKIMIYIGNHKNIIQFIGAYTVEINLRKLFLIVKYCELGSMETFLRTHRHLFGKVPINYENLKKSGDQDGEDICKSDLMDWSLQICNGMNFLAEKRVIHGDLACRNVLLDKNKIAKITDFGLSRQIFNCSNYIKTNSKENPLPWRCLALETLKHLSFSTKSDVWAFGITLWEIFSLARVPYPGLNYTNNFIKMLEDGLRLTKPDLCSIQVYEIMSQCWLNNPNDRPEFPVLLQKLGNSNNAAAVG